jgi:hypothetical protein
LRATVATRRISRESPRAIASRIATPYGGNGPLAFEDFELTRRDCFELVLVGDLDFLLGIRRHLFEIEEREAVVLFCRTFFKGMLKSWQVNFADPCDAYLIVT